MERAGRLAGKLKVAGALADPETRACAVWSRAAGKKVAEHSRAVALVRGKLIVEVEDIVWQRQLNTLRHFLIRNLAKELGEVVVTDLDFRPMPPRRKPQRAEAARPADEVSQIGDPVLRGIYRDTVRKKA